MDCRKKDLKFKFSFEFEFPEKKLLNKTNKMINDYNTHTHQPLEYSCEQFIY